MRLDKFTIHALMGNLILFNVCRWKFEFDVQIPAMNLEEVIPTDVKFEIRRQIGLGIVGTTFVLWPEVPGSISLVELPEPLFTHHSSTPSKPMCLLIHRRKKLKYRKLKRCLLCRSRFIFHQQDFLFFVSSSSSFKFCSKHTNLVSNVYTMKTGGYVCWEVGADLYALDMTFFVHY